MCTSEGINPETKNTKMKITLENTNHLTSEEATIARCLASHDKTETIRQFSEFMRVALGGEWFVYDGGSHVALHRRKNDWNRILIATE